MPTLKRYIADQCADPAFRGLYEGFCEVCALTVELAARLHRLGLTIEAAAAECGVTVGEMTDLLNADRCSPAAVGKICVRLGVAPPADCRKKRGQKKPPGRVRREGD